MVRLLRWAAAGSAAIAMMIGAGVVCAQAPADTPANPFADDRTAVAGGKAVFEGACAACHGSGAVGGRGPALNAGRFARGGDDYQIFSTIHDGVRGTEMPAFGALPANDIWKVVSYLRSLSQQPGAGAARSEPPLPGDPARGEALFFGKAGCSACHEVNGRGGDQAADLSAIGAGGAAVIRTGMLHRSTTRRFGANTRYVDVVLANGQAVSGLVRGEDSFTLHLQRSDGELLMLDRRTLRSVKTAPGGLAPADVEQRLRPQDLDDVAAYLAAQKARNVKGVIPLRRPAPPSAERLEKSRAEPANWLTYWGDYQGHHFSDLAQIKPSNVAGLQARWVAQLPGPSPLQSTPLVVDGVMYVSGTPGEVYAFDARTGLQIWKFSRKQDVVNPYQINPSNRGVAVMDGRVFVGTLDNLLIAIDARTGRELWERRIADTLEGFTITGAPLALPGRVVVGVGGGEYGLRGFLDAYDPATGEHVWRFTTIPGPGEPGNETWLGDSWKLGGGGTWLTGAYDPELKLLYWAVGNPAPGFNPHVRKGDNLYTNSVLALDPATGKLRWHYQFTPNDSHDWDSAQDMVLADQKIGRATRKVLLHADRNGFFYVLDRTNGAFLRATAFVRQTWNDGFEVNGRPRVRPQSVATPQGPPVFPAVGATNFQAPSYDRRSGVLYVAFLDAQAAIASGEPMWERGRVYAGGRRAPVAGPAIEPIQGIKAIDTMTGRELWRFPLVRNSLAAGVLGTGGGVLFASSAEGTFIGLDMKTGEPLWRFRAGAPISASPMSYAVDGEQHVAVVAGNALYSFALPKTAKGVR